MERTSEEAKSKLDFLFGLRAKIVEALDSHSPVSGNYKPNIHEMARTDYDIINGIIRDVKKAEGISTTDEQN